MLLLLRSPAAPGGGGGPGPTIFRVAASSVLPATALITWQTDVPADSQVKYGLDGVTYPYLSAYDPTLTTTHSVTIATIVPGEEHHYRVLSST